MSNGLGFASARMMAEQGARIVIIDLVGAGPDKAAALLGNDNLGLVADITDKTQCEAAVAKIVERYGRIDILFNNAGITQPRKTLDITDADYDAILDVSLRGTLHMSQAVIPTMQKQKSGSIICTSSVSAQRGGGILGGPHYSAAKAGCPRISPRHGPRIRSGQHPRQLHHTGPDRYRYQHKGKIPEDRRAAILESIPLGCIGEPADVGGACVFLASDLSKYVTGVTLDVNGGMLIH